MTPLIQLENIVKNYRRHRALDGIDLQIMPGVTALLGPNGAGKSSLIKSILGLIRVTSGTGTVLGHRLVRDGRKIRNDVGYMPEDDCYIPGMSGVQVVHFAAMLSGLPEVEGMRRAHEILDFCDVKQERYRAIESYSTGMRQKIKFAAAIVHDPKFLILDEPTSGLDPEEREALLRKIRLMYQDAGKSVLISTHIIPDVQAICDHVIIIADGKVKLDQSLEKLNQRGSPTCEVIAVGDVASLVDDLASRSMDVSQLVNGNLEVRSLVPGDGPEQVAAALWQSAGKTSVTVLSVTPATNSLEATFLRTVEESSLEVASAR